MRFSKHLVLSWPAVLTPLPVAITAEKLIKSTGIRFKRQFGNSNATLRTSPIALIHLTVAKIALTASWLIVHCDDFFRCSIESNGIK